MFFKAKHSCTVHMSSTNYIIISPTKRLFSFIATVLVFIGSNLAKANITGYQKFLSDKAVQNLQSLEASHMVYGVYENFIVPRICQNNKEIYGGKNKSACKLFGHVKANDFKEVSADTTRVLFKAKDSYTKMANHNFEGAKPNLLPAAPKGYRVSYVGCYRRPKNRETLHSECSLFFMILEGVNNRKPPIIAIKGTSHSEDWKNNLFAGAPILNEISSVFAGLFRELKGSIIGGVPSENSPAEIKGLSGKLSAFFRDLSANSYRLVFTGHSLGGALAQELAREIFIATREDIRDRSSGPNIEVITWNGLSYTSMIGRLKKGLKNLSDPVLKGGWKEEDALKLENFKSIFDGHFLSAVNYHTADDLLTSFINNGIIGRFLRIDGQEEMIHAGADVLLATERDIAIKSVKEKITGHSTLTLLKDALYSMGAVEKNGRIAPVSLESQLARLKVRRQNNQEAAKYKDTPQYFMQNGYNSDRYNKDGSINFDLTRVAKDIENHEIKADKYRNMEDSLIKNSRYLGRLLGPESGLEDLSKVLSTSLY